jgi:hypothetical protein
MVSPCQDVLELFMQLPVGPPYLYTRNERGRDDGYYGRDPRENDPDYMAGYAVGLEMLEAKKEVKRAKEDAEAQQHVSV